jgi:hypothetical protein
MSNCCELKTKRKSFLEYIKKPASRSTNGCFTCRFWRKNTEKVISSSDKNISLCKKLGVFTRGDSKCGYFDRILSARTKFRDYTRGGNDYREVDEDLFPEDY